MKSKKSISLIVSYVLLVAIVLSIAILVYIGWKNKLFEPPPKCPENVALVIESYSCDPAANTITLTIKNKGMFDVDGFRLKFNDKSTGLPYIDAGPKDQNFIIGGVTGIDIDKSYTTTLNYNTKIEQIQIIPVRKEKNKFLYCSESSIIQPVVGCD